MDLVKVCGERGGWLGRLVGRWVGRLCGSGSGYEYEDMALGLCATIQLHENSPDSFAGVNGVFIG